MKRRSPTTRGRGGSARNTMKMRARATPRRRSPSLNKNKKTGSGKASRAKSARNVKPAGRTALKTKSGRSDARLTTDHEEIRRWVEDRGGHPAAVKSSSKIKNAAGILRIDFPGYSGKASLKPISWDEWFATFDDRRLGFLYQKKTASGKSSRFNKLICR